MDKNAPGQMTPFDEFVTTPELQIIKLLIPYAPASGRQTLAAMVKYTELRHAIQLFRKDNHTVSDWTFEHDSPENPSEIINLLRPYLNPQQSSMLDMVIQIQDMMPLFEMIRATQTASENTPDNPSQTFDLSSLLSGMLTPEQQDLFSMYSEMFDQAQENHNYEKGDKKDEQ